MHPLLRPFLLPCALVIAMVLGAAVPARAEDQPAPAPAEGVDLPELRPEEIAFLKKKFPEWDTLSPERRAHIARNVIRLREMNDEERAKLKSRVDRLRRGRKGGHKSRGAGLFRLADAVGERVLARLPAEVRVEVGKLDVRPSMVRMTLFRKLKSKAASAEPTTFTESQLAAMPASVRVRVQKMVADVEAGGDEKRIAALKGRIQRMHLLKRLEALRKDAGTDSSGTQQAEAVLGAWQAAADQLVAEITANPGAFLASVQRAERDHVTPTDFQKTVWSLERLALGKWRRDPEALAAADRVVRRILIDELRADPRAVKALPGYEDPRGRRRALGKLLGGSEGAGRRGGWRGPGRREGGPPRTGPRKGPGRGGKRAAPRDDTERGGDGK